jgi:hypothetical protein
MRNENDINKKEKERDRKEQNYTIIERKEGKVEKGREKRERERRRKEQDT